MKGLPCSVFVNKEYGDCSNRGVTSRVKSVILLDPAGVSATPLPGVFEPTDDCPALVLKEKNLFGNPYYYAVPIDLARGGQCVMFGGAFIYTSDSRFPSRQPIAVHDRVERTHERAARFQPASLFCSRGRPPCPGCCQRV